MLTKIHERGAGYVASLLGLRQPLMRRAHAMILGGRKYSWGDLGRGVSSDFVLTLLSLAILTYLIWGFDYINRLYDSVVINLFSAVLPPLAFFEAMRQERKGLRLSLWNVEFAFFLVLALLLAISDSYDVVELGINVVVIMASSPWLVIFGMLVRQKRILAIGMVPAAIILMGYWVVPGFLDGLKLQYFLIPLPAVSILLASWTLLVWILFKGVDRWPKDPTLGPLMESLAMLSLFIPIMVLAIWVPRTIPGGEDWSVVLAAMVGVVFGSVVSEPLTRFLRSYGNLPSARRNDGGDEVEQGQDTERKGS